VLATAGTSVRNPVDIGLVLGGAAEMYRRAVEATVADPGVDAAVVIGGFARGEGWQEHIEAISALSAATGKPIIEVSFGSSDLVVDRALAQAGIPSFRSAERALRAYALACREKD
jgi:acyl-CoA synthetase (NDP forming)